MKDSITWMDMTISTLHNHTFLDYHRGIQIQNIEFDVLRFCELENIIHMWKKTMTKRQTLDEFIELFSENFIIECSYFDCMKFIFYKIIMKANKVGVVKKNKFTNYEIEVIEKNEIISNEIQCLGLLNIVHAKKSTQVRMGDEIWFYFTDLQY